MLYLLSLDVELKLADLKVSQITSDNYQFFATQTHK